MRCPTSAMVQRYTVFIPGVVVERRCGTRQRSWHARRVTSPSTAAASGEANMTARRRGDTQHERRRRLAARYRSTRQWCRKSPSRSAAPAPSSRWAASCRTSSREQGGNNFSGLTYFHYTNESFSGDNLSDELEALGLGGAGAMRESWDINPARRRSDPARQALVLRRRIVTGGTRSIRAPLQPHAHGLPVHAGPEPADGVATGSAIGTTRLRLTWQISPEATS